jgi:hypothetical protein
MSKSRQQKDDMNQIQYSEPAKITHHQKEILRHCGTVTGFLLLCINFFHCLTTDVCLFINRYDEDNWRRRNEEAKAQVGLQRHRTRRRMNNTQILNTVALHPQF